jgi:hypothetical protein
VLQEICAVSRGLAPLAAIARQSKSVERYSADLLGALRCAVHGHELPSSLDPDPESLLTSAAFRALRSWNKNPFGEKPVIQPMAGFLFFALPSNERPKKKQGEKAYGALPWTSFPAKVLSPFRGALHFHPELPRQGG